MTFFFFANSLKIVLLFCILHLSALPPPCPHRANILSLLKVFLLQLRFYKPRAFPAARGCTSGRGAGQDFEDISAVTNLQGCFCKSESNKIIFSPTSSLPNPDSAQFPACPVASQHPRPGEMQQAGSLPPHSSSRAAQPLSLKTFDSLSS